MSLLDTYRRSCQRKQDEIARLLGEKANLQKKLSDLNLKTQKTNKAIRSTKSLNTIQSKNREIERYQKESANLGKKIAEVEAKMAKRQTEFVSEEKKMIREEEKQTQKRNQEAKKQLSNQHRQMNYIDNRLSEHDKLHTVTQAVLEGLKELPEKIIVLFLASNPIDQNQLRLDEEARSIVEMIRKAKHRDSVKLVSCWAVRPVDVLQAINEYSPAIVHFSGHGSDQDEIVFQDNSGGTKLVSKEAIVQTMMASCESIRLIFFNTCYSHNQAREVVEHVEVAIGMKTSISDDAARLFSSQFYSAIGFGLSVKQAFEQAKALLMMEGIPEESTPELFIHDGIDPHGIVIVKPPSVAKSS